MIDIEKIKIAIQQARKSLLLFENNEIESEEMTEAFDNLYGLLSLDVISEMVKKYES